MKITQELKNLLSEKDLEIENLRAEKDKLLYDYAANLGYKVGTKLKIIDSEGNERFALIKNIELSYFDFLKFSLQKMKKDGTNSKSSDHISSSDKVEIVND